MKFLIVTAGGRARKKQLGMGHIFRTLNLVEHLKTSKIFFLVEDHGGSMQIIKKNGYRTFLLEKNLSVNSRISVTLDIIKKLKIDAVIIDWNNIEKKYVRKIRNNVKTIVITDMKNKEFDADLIVNGFIGFKNSIIKNSFGSKCLLGPRFQILHKEFSKSKKHPKKNNLLVTFGGFDEKNITEFVLNRLTKNKNIKAKIILGPATAKTRSIHQLEKNLKQTVDIVTKTDNMYKEMKSAEFGICSGGLTSYEFAASGTPFAIICQLEHQLLAAKEWEKRGYAINFGLYNNKSKKKLIEKIKELPIKKFKVKNRRLVDGSGGKRVAYEINNCLTKIHRK